MQVYNEAPRDPRGSFYSHESLVPQEPAWNPLRMSDRAVKDNVFRQHYLDRMRESLVRKREEKGQLKLRVKQLRSQRL